MNLSEKLTTQGNFRLREFLWSEHCQRHAALAIHPRIRAAQLWTMQLIAKQLEIIRSWHDVPLNLLSGMRDQAIHLQLLADGIRSSSITDHAYYHPDLWPFGVGAVDFAVSGQTPKQVFDAIRKNQHDLEFSYVILYPWGVHLSGPADSVMTVRPTRERFMTDRSCTSTVDPDGG